MDVYCKDFLLDRAVIWLHHLAVHANLDSLQKGWDVEKELVIRERRLLFGDRIEDWADCLWLRCVLEVRKERERGVLNRTEIVKNTIIRSLRGGPDEKEGDSLLFVFEVAPEIEDRESVYTGVACRCIELVHRLEDHGSLDRPGPV